MQERAPTLRYTYIACLVTSWYDKKDAEILNKIRNIRRLKIWELNPNINGTVVVVAFILTYVLTPWSRVLLEKLTGSAASQEIHRIFGTRMFLTVLTSARHLSLSWAKSIQSPQPPPTSWRSILILSSHLRLGLPNGPFPSGVPTTNLHTYRISLSALTFTCYRTLSFCLASYGRRSSNNTRTETHRKTLIHKNTDPKKYISWKIIILRPCILKLA